MLSNIKFYNPECKRCGLYKTAQHVCVKPRGSDDPEVIFVGMAPGKDENRLNKPFVGEAGNVLKQVFRELDINQSRYRMTNIVRCIPWLDPEAKYSYKVRDPSPEEIKQCELYLIMELLNFDPNKVTLVALGNKSMEQLTGRKKISQFRGEELECKLIPNKTFKVIPTYHPAAYLHGGRDPELLSFIKRDVAKAFNIVINPLEGRIYKMLDNLEDIQEFADDVVDLYKNKKIPYVAYDLETTGLKYFDPSTKLLSAGFSFKETTGYAIPL